MRKTYIIIILCTVIACLTSCAGKANPDAAASLPEKQLRYQESKTDKVTYFPYQNILDQYGEPVSFYTAGNGEAYFLYHYGEEDDSHSGEEGDTVSGEEGDAASNLVVKYDAQSGTCEELVLESDGILYGSIHMSPEGTLILGAGERGYLYAQGSTSPHADLPCYPACGMIFPEPGILVCKAHVASDYYRFDLTTGQTAGETYLDRGFLYGDGMRYQTCLNQSGDSILLVTEAGIYEAEEGGFTLKVPSGKTSMYKPSFSPVRVWKEGESYLVEDGTFQYRYEPVEIPAGEEEITLKLASLKESSLLKEAIVDYQIEHPYITIDYHYYVRNLSWDQEYVTAMQQINSAITSDQAADIYLLDSLPYQEYAAKGCLADITELAEAYVQDGDYFGKVMESIRASDGRFYALPQFFMAQCVVVREEDHRLMEDFAGSIHDFAGFLKEYPDSRGLLGYYFKDRPDNFMKAVYQFYGKELQKDGAFTRESVMDFLESASVIYDHLQRSSVQKGSPYDYSVSNYPETTESGLFYQKKEGDMLFYTLSPYSLTIFSQARHFGEYHFTAAGGCQLKGVLGIHTKTGQKEASADFLRYLLDYYQEKDVSALSRAPGIPLYRPATEKYLEFYKNGIKDRCPEGYYSYDLNGEEYPLYLQTREDMAEITVFLDQFDYMGTLPEDTDEVYRLLKERSRGFLEGDRTLEEAAGDVFAGLSLLQAEIK